MIFARAWRSHGAKLPERRHNPLILRMFVLMTVEDQLDGEMFTIGEDGGRCGGGSGVEDGGGHVE